MVDPAGPCGPEGFVLWLLPGVGGTYHPLRPFDRPFRLTTFRMFSHGGGWFRVSLANPESVPEESSACGLTTVFLWWVGAQSPTLHLLLPTCCLAAVLVARFFGWSLDRRLESPSREFRSPPSLTTLTMRQIRM